MQRKQGHLLLRNAQQQRRDVGDLKCATTNVGMQNWHGLGRFLNLS